MSQTKKTTRPVTKKTPGAVDARRDLRTGSGYALAGAYEIAMLPAGRIDPAYARDYLEVVRAKLTGGRLDAAIYPAIRLLLDSPVKSLNSATPADLRNAIR